MNCNPIREREDWFITDRKPTICPRCKKKEGSNLVPYSFRHYYSLRGHIAGIDSGSMASSMGHSIEAHHRAYPYSSKASTTNAFRQARERLTA